MRKVSENYLSRHFSRKSVRKYGEYFANIKIFLTYFSPTKYQHQQIKQRNVFPQKYYYRIWWLSNINHLTVQADIKEKVR